MSDVEVNCEHQGYGTSAKHQRLPGRQLEITTRRAQDDERIAIAHCERDIHYQNQNRCFKQACQKGLESQLECGAPARRRQKGAEAVPEA